jgi:hypothetical protein
MTTEKERRALLDLNLLSENYYSEEQINIKVLSGALQYD